jgi:branched-chain amino acid transport system permease protein
MPKLQRGASTAIGIAVVFLALLLWRYGTGIPTANNLLAATTVGLAVGALYAMTASGLVVVYTTTGIFNFAQGAIGVFCAFLFWDLTERDEGFLWFEGVSSVGMNRLLALVVGVVAPFVGAMLDVVIMRRLRTASLVIQLMVTVGLMIFFLTLTAQLYPAETRSVDHFFDSTGFEFGGTTVLWHRLLVIVVAAAIAIALRLVLYNTRLGVAMRAVVDNRNLADLNGTRANVVSSFAWSLGSSLAALAGILIAPEIELSPETLNSVVFVALAAAAFGQLRSLPLAVLGALIIGLLESHYSLWLQLGPDFRDARSGIAPIVLLLVLLALPQSRLAVGRAAHNLRPRERITKWWEAGIGAVALVIAVVVFARGLLNFGIWDPGAWSSTGLNNGLVALSLALVALSLVPLTGWAGQVNFAPLAFAGFGAMVFHMLTEGDGNMLWLPVVAVATAALGALVALPAARLQGLYLALMSMAFVQIMASVVFPHGNLLQGNRQYGNLRIGGTPVYGEGVDPAALPDRSGVEFTGGIVFDTRESLLYLIAGVLGLGIFLLILLRNSRWGRRWVALNDSQAASATVGVNVVGTKVAVYALSGAMAGVAGCFWATGQGGVNAGKFDLFLVFELVLLMAAAGMSIPAAALFLTFRFVFQALLEKLETIETAPIIVQQYVDLNVWLLDTVLVPFGPGMLAIGMVVNQRGAMYEMGRGFAPLLPWRKDAREELAAERAAKRPAEVGELGIDRPFTNEEAVELDRMLGIQDDVIPPEGYRDLTTTIDLRVAGVGSDG